MKKSVGRVGKRQSKKLKEIDPEDNPFRSDDEDLSEEADDAEIKSQGREHYENVGKSSLRKEIQPSLGVKYAGKTVRRSALEDGTGDSMGSDTDEDPFAPVDENDDDPFALPVDDEDSEKDDEDDGTLKVNGDIDEDEEIDSDEAFGVSDEEKFASFKFSGSLKKQDQSSRSKNPKIDETITGEEDDDTQSTDESDGLTGDDADNSLDGSDNVSGSMSEESSSVSSAESIKSLDNSRTPTTNREKLKALLQHDTAAVTSALSASTTADIEKGRAVKQQYQTYDRLLDARIKMQKGVTAINDHSFSSTTKREEQDAIQRAEKAALTLWSTINSIRHDISTNQEPAPNSTSKKRKASTPLIPTTSTPLTNLWQEMTELEIQSRPHRRTVLDKWSTKTRSAAPRPTASRLLDASQQADQNKITIILDTYLSEESTRSKPTTTLSENNLNSRLSPYSDTQFYQTLLRDLISSRTSLQTSSSTTTILPTKLHQSGSKHKKIDTKASKGRKVRYDVHDKLLNFMAPEDRTTWSDQAAREFFGSLFGGAGLLREDIGMGDGDGEYHEEGEDREGEALRLFRN